MNARADVLWQQGNHIENSLDLEYTYSLYSLFNFYVEVKIHKQQNQIVEVISFKTGERFDKYLEKIKID